MSSQPRPAACPPPAPAPPLYTISRLMAVAGISILVWAAIITLCSLIGPSGLDWKGWDYCIFRLRRLLPASLVGAALSVAGVGLQSLLRNPLASPEVLGVSSGAAVGAFVAMIAGATGVIAPLSVGARTAAAAIGGIVTIMIVYGVAQRRGRVDPYTLLLTGVVVSAFNGAIIMFLYLLATQEVFRDLTTWAMGQVPEQADFGAVAVAGAVIFVCWGVMLTRAKAFNVQTLGDDVATSSGVNIEALRLTTFAAAALMTAAAVALAGPIAFVGLIVPHITRRLFGPDHRTLLVTSGFIGAGFLAAADTVCRSMVWLRTGELPVGIITAISGGPFFIYLLRRRFKEVR